jgi:hypothetical protein
MGPNFGHSQADVIKSETQMQTSEGIQSTFFVKLGFFVLDKIYPNSILM